MFPFHITDGCICLHISLNEQDKYSPLRSSA